MLKNNAIITTLIRNVPLQPIYLCIPKSTMTTATIIPIIRTYIILPKNNEISERNFLSCKSPPLFNEYNKMNLISGLIEILKKDTG